MFMKLKKDFEVNEEGDLVGFLIDGVMNDFLPDLKQRFLTRYR